MEEDLGGVRRALRSDNGGGSCDFSSERSPWVMSEKLSSDSGVAGGDSGRLGAYTWASSQAFP